MQLRLAPAAEPGFAAPTPLPYAASPLQLQLQWQPPLQPLALHASRRWASTTSGRGSLLLFPLLSLAHRLGLRRDAAQQPRELFDRARPYAGAWADSKKTNAGCATSLSKCGNSSSRVLMTAYSKGLRAPNLTSGYDHQHVFLPKRVRTAIERGGREFGEMIAKRIKRSG